MDVPEEAVLDVDLLGDDGSEDEGESQPATDFYPGPASTPTSCTSSPREEPASPHGGSQPAFFHHQPYHRPFFTAGRRGRPRKDGPKLQREGKIVRRYRGGPGSVRGAKRHRSSRDEADELMEDDEFTMPAPEEPPYMPEKWPGKVCALCNLSERSQLGQGEMRMVPCGGEGGSTPAASGASTPTGENTPTPTTPSTPVPPDLQSPPELDPTQHPLALPLSRRQKAFNKCKTPLYNLEHTDELSIIGHIEPLDLSAVISSGLYVHRMCLEFSPPHQSDVAASVADEDKDKTEEARIKGIVTAGLARKCSFCTRHGASIPCKMSCSKYFHLPCVLASGGFMDFHNKASFCKDHLYQVPLVCSADIECRTCHTIGDINNLMTCVTCGAHHHGTCVGLAQLPGVRAGWACRTCRVCQVCRQESTPGGGGDTRAVACEHCDKLYHAACTRPVMATVPKYGWKCKCCRVCSDCGARSPGAGPSSRWHAHYTVCDSCYQQRNKGSCCPLCRRAYRAAAYRAMIRCTICRRYVHGMCDPDAEPSLYNQKKEQDPSYDYHCPLCKAHLLVGGSFDDETLASTSQDSSFTDDNSNSQQEQDPLAIEPKTDVGLGKGKPYTVSSKVAKQKMGGYKLKGGYPPPGKIGFKQRQRSALEFGRKRGSKPKMRGMFGVPGLGLQRPQAPDNRTPEDDPSVENKLVLCSSKDKFVLTQDLCVMCGAIGTDSEGCLVACSQCGQTYHPYCVNVKVSQVIVGLGWRCLDCTVCEGCGHRGDEPLLVLCDDCDTTWHTYCARPQLTEVPRSAWRCERCRKCLVCGTKETVGWCDNYTECAPCASLVMCCVCSEPYSDGELIIQCEGCRRWLHAACDAIRSESDAETCCRQGYKCVLCRGRDVPPPHMVRAIEPPRPAPRPTLQSLGLGGEFYVDDTCLSQRGANHMKQLETELGITHTRRKRRFKNDNTEKEAVVQNTDADAGDDAKPDTTGEHKEDNGTPTNANLKEGVLWNVAIDGPAPEGFTIYTTDSGLTVLRRKRQRNLNKLGIGGFVVRQRQNAKAPADDEKEGDSTLGSGESPGNKRKARRKPRSKLMEQFPSYMQEAFFGKELLEPTKSTVSSTGNPSESPSSVRPGTPEGYRELRDFKLDLDNSDSEGEDVLPALASFVDQDTSFVITLNTEEVELLQTLKPKEEKEDSNSVKIKLEIDDQLKHTEDSTELEKAILGPKIEEVAPSTDSIPTVHSTKTEPVGEPVGPPQPSPLPNKEELLLGDRSLLDAMVRDSLPDMDGNDVDEIFKGVLTDDSQESQESSVSNVPYGIGCTTYGQSRQPPQSPQLYSPYNNEFGSSASALSPLLGEGTWNEQPAPPNYNQRSTDKMRADESLGSAATISAVLYANTNHPEWKTEFPNWVDRCKQILKKWRALPGEQKAPYLQRARDNRSAIRMKKAQQSTPAEPEPPPPVAVPTPAVPVPVRAPNVTVTARGILEADAHIRVLTPSEIMRTLPRLQPATVATATATATVAVVNATTEQERACGQQRSAREAEQERQWKQLQQMRQQQTQQQQQIIHDQRIQAMQRLRAPDGGDAPPAPLAPAEAPRSAFPAQRFPLHYANSEDINRQLRDLLQRHPDKMWQQGGEEGVIQGVTLEGQPFRHPLPAGLRPRLMQPAQRPEHQIVMQQRLINAEGMPMQQIQNPAAQSTEQKPAGQPTESHNKRKTMENPAGGESKTETDQGTDEMDMGDMEKLEQDSGNIGEVGDILTGLGGEDDEELLESLTAEIGEQFNILEYADPELAALNDTENILDGLELADEPERHTKREPPDESGQKSKSNTDLHKSVKNIDNIKTDVKSEGEIKSEVQDAKDVQMFGDGVQRVITNQQMAMHSAMQAIKSEIKLEGEDINEGEWRGVQRSLYQHQSVRLQAPQGVQRAAQFPSQALGQPRPQYSQQVHFQQGTASAVNTQSILNAMTAQVQAALACGRTIAPGTRLVGADGAVGVVRHDRTVALAQAPHTVVGVSRAPPPPPYPGTLRQPQPPPPPYPQAYGPEWGEWLHRRPMLLQNVTQEQPLLLAELLEQEQREQERDGSEWGAVVAPPPPVPAPAIPLYAGTPPPAPPPPPDRPIAEADHHARLLYEQWLKRYNAFATDQLRYYESEVQKLRKQRKSLNSKQRQLRKSGNELLPNDAAELQRVSTEQQALQKHLEAARKQARQHSMLIQEYETKQRQNNPQLAQQPVITQQPQQISTNQTVFTQNQNMPQSPMQQTINRPMQLQGLQTGIQQQQTLIRTQQVINSDGQLSQQRIGLVTSPLNTQGRIITQGGRTLVIEQGQQQQLVRQLSGVQERPQSVGMVQFGQQQMGVRTAIPSGAQTPRPQRPAMSPLHVQSPHSQSPLHSLAPQSPLHHLTSPMQSPLHSQQSPLHHTSQSPLHPSTQSPLHTQQSPLHSQQSPMHVQQTNLQQSPMHQSMHQSPMLSQQSPMHQSPIHQSMHAQNQGMQQNQGQMQQNQGQMQQNQGQMQQNQGQMQQNQGQMQQNQGQMQQNQGQMQQNQGQMQQNQGQMQQNQGQMQQNQGQMQQNQGQMQQNQGQMQQNQGQLLQNQSQMQQSQQMQQNQGQMQTQHSPMHPQQSPMHLQQSPLHSQQSPMHSQSPMSSSMSPQHFLQQLQNQRTSPQLPAPSRSPQIYQPSHSPKAQHSPQMQPDYNSRFPRPGCSPLGSRFARPPHPAQTMRGGAYGARQTSPLGSPQPLPSPGNPNSDRQQMIQRQQYSPMGGAPASPSLSRSPHVARTPTPQASPAASPAPNIHMDHGGGGHHSHHMAPMPPGYRYFKPGLFGGAPIWPTKDDNRRPTHINKVSILKKRPQPRFPGKTAAPTPEERPEQGESSHKYVLYSTDSVDYTSTSEDTQMSYKDDDDDDDEIEEYVEHLDDDDIVVVEPGAMSPEERIATEEDFEELIDSRKPEDDIEEEIPVQEKSTRTETTTKTVAVISLAPAKQPSSNMPNVQQYKLTQSAALSRLQPVLSASVLSQHANTKILNEVSQTTVASVSIANQTINVPVLKNLPTGQGSKQLKKLPLNITNPPLTINMSSAPYSKPITSVISVISSNVQKASMSPVITLATPNTAAGPSRVPMSLLTQHQVQQKIVKTIEKPIGLSLSSPKVSSLSVSHDATLPAKIFQDDAASPDSTIVPENHPEKETFQSTLSMSQQQRPPPIVKDSKDIDIETEISQHTELPHSLCIADRTPLLLGKADIKSPDPIPEKIPDNIMEGDDEDKPEDSLRGNLLMQQYKTAPEQTQNPTETQENVSKTIKAIANQTKDMVMVGSNLQITPDMGQSSVQISIPSPTPSQERYLNDITMQEHPETSEGNQKHVECFEDMLSILDNIDETKTYGKAKPGPNPTQGAPHLKQETKELLEQNLAQRRETERLGLQSATVPQLSPLSQPAELTSNMANVSQQLRSIMSSLNPNQKMDPQNLPRKIETAPTQVNFENLLPSSKVEVAVPRPSPGHRIEKPITSLPSESVPMSAAQMVGSRVNALSSLGQIRKSPSVSPINSPVGSQGSMMKSPAQSPLITHQSFPASDESSSQMMQNMQMPALSKIYSSPQSTMIHTSNTITTSVSGFQKAQQPLPTSILGHTLLQPARQVNTGLPFNQQSMQSISTSQPPALVMTSRPLLVGKEPSPNVTIRTHTIVSPAVSQMQVKPTVSGPVSFITSSKLLHTQLTSPLKRSKSTDEPKSEVIVGHIQPTKRHSVESVIVKSEPMETDDPNASTEIGNKTPQQIAAQKYDESQNVLLKQLLQTTTATTASGAVPQRTMNIQRTAPALGTIPSLEAQLARPSIPPPTLSMTQEVEVSKNSPRMITTVNSPFTPRSVQTLVSTPSMSPLMQTSLQSLMQTSTPSLIQTSVQSMMQTSGQSPMHMSSQSMIQTSTQSLMDVRKPPIKIIKEETTPLPETSPTMKTMQMYPMSMDNQQLQQAIKKEIAPPMQSPVHRPFTPMDVKKELLDESSQQSTTSGISTASDSKLDTPMKEEYPESVSMDVSSEVNPAETPSEAKKRKRREYQQKKRRQMQMNMKAAAENNLSAANAKKKPRKGSRYEEDYDTFIDNLMSNLRSLPPMQIQEPALSTNFAVCPLFGSGDLTKLKNKDYDILKGDLVGEFGNAKIPNVGDYYNTKPFGDDEPVPEKPPASTQRGFYDQEFQPIQFDEDPDEKKLEFICKERDTDTPDSIVSCSSPECYEIEPANRFPGLKFIEDDEDEDDEDAVSGRISPIIPIIAPVPIRMKPVSLYQIKDEDDALKSLKSSDTDLPMRKMLDSPGSTESNENVTVTLTLTSGAAEDILGVLKELAGILHIPPPTSYQIVERTATPPSHKLGLYRSKGKDGKEGTPIDIQSILNGAAKFCRHCDVVILDSVVRAKASEFPLLSANKGNAEEILCDSDSELFFCSAQCYERFAWRPTNIILDGKSKTTLKDDTKSIDTNISKERDDFDTASTESMETDDLDIKPDIKDEKMDLSFMDGLDNDELMKEVGDDVSALDEDLKSEQDEKSNQSVEKEKEKYKGTRYKHWSPGCIGPPFKYKRPTDRELTELVFRTGVAIMPVTNEDARKCELCGIQGDGVADGVSRLLNCDVDRWVHLNCALWSDGVYETISGALMNVETALANGSNATCAVCRRLGATVRCFKLRCGSVYHLGCAVKDNCVFYKNKSAYCSSHAPKNEKDNELTTLSVQRRVYISRDEMRQVASVMLHSDTNHLIRVGGLIFLSPGHLLPHQLAAFHTPNYIYPIGYKIVRFYWSMSKANSRCRYICWISEEEGRPRFHVRAQEDARQEMCAATPRAAWASVLDAVGALREARGEDGVLKLWHNYVSGEDLFGLTEPAVVRVLESLPGIETLTDYRFKFGRSALLEGGLAVNPSGCARSEPRLRSQWRRPPRSAVPCTPAGPSSSSPEAACPYTKQFVHTKSSQYKKMKMEWRNNVYLARSKIQGLGLYAARDIEKHTMVIEYIGEIIRSELSEIREKQYEAKNRGIYMFRLDERRVVDATLSGGLARYINHSCQPNCVAETVEVDRHTRIIIFAKRRIARGEELAYDYKFDIEDDLHKIMCMCGAPNCRKWMN